MVFLCYQAKVTVLCCGSGYDRFLGGLVSEALAYRSQDGYNQGKSR